MSISKLARTSGCCCANSTSPLLPIAMFVSGRCVCVCVCVCLSVSARVCGVRNVGHIVLRCVAVCCSVLQGVAGRCSVLQCVAVCCSVL